MTDAKAAVYGQIRQLQRQIAVALEEVTAAYDHNSCQIAAIAEEQVRRIRDWEKDALNQIQKIKKVAIISIQDEWKRFKKYSRAVRKAYLGQQAEPNLNYDFTCIRLGLQKLVSGITDMNSTTIRLKEAFSEENAYRKESNSEENESLTIPLKSSEETLVNKIEPDFTEISPIKAKNNQKQTKQTNSQVVSELATSQRINKQSNGLNNQIQRSIRTQNLQQVRSSKHIEKFQTIFSSSSILKSQIRKAETSVTPSRRLQTNSNLNHLQERSPFELSRVKSEENLGKMGIKSCLQRLQRQQILYEKLHYGSK